ncbi:uncharacterized protein LACBIDRAFT_312430 [Laccaria bicolor S238N-H82]|uniref:Predicted protein n=1 Tax=Laccaria bicolor (strain S238N-H82 / ATCC MYA-4686) TaxID=486041 RepID=B0DW52_LACBS|nr:uncharacterized protein LACBIDRAFT_312430 [Laccaria bicolor S238N-H82]EDR01121.1 predicted protein [Laccaria bicolor S238N-H82]|eukprot:XP_001888163.1 predicted protein [Laccaria bicolor S238N-H82]
MRYASSLSFFILSMSHTYGWLSQITEDSDSLLSSFTAFLHSVSIPVFCIVTKLTRRGTNLARTRGHIHSLLVVGVCEGDGECNVGDHCGGEGWGRGC